MTLLAIDLHQQTRLPCDAGHHPERQMATLQHWPLLHVHLDVALDRLALPGDRHDTCRAVFKAMVLQHLRQGLAVGCLGLQHPSLDERACTFTRLLSIATRML